LSSSPESMKRCKSAGPPSIGRIVVHPLTAIMSRRAANNLIGCFHGKAFLR
jgi:hypothetical protein